MQLAKFHSPNDLKRQVPRGNPELKAEYTDLICSFGVKSSLFGTDI